MIKMNPEKDFFKFSKDILTNEKMLSSEKNIQHGRVSVFTHSVMVARYSFLLDWLLDLGSDKSALIRGALLHDFFLYDWHKIPKEIAKRGLHGFKHPIIAAENASKHFSLTPEEYAVIITHMWPLTFTKIPFTKEGWIVCVTDKICSLLETLKLQPYTDAKTKKWIDRNLEHI